MIKKSLILLALLGFILAFPQQPLQEEEQQVESEPIVPTDAVTSILNEEAETEAIRNATKETEYQYRVYVGEQQFPVPFKTILGDSLRQGQTVHAIGTVSDQPKLIKFIFHKGNEKDADQPLHLAIHFGEDYTAEKLVYSTFIDGNWSVEEQGTGAVPFKANGTFDIRVRLLNGTFVVYGNRQEIGSFEQRESFAGVDHISISGCLAELRVFHYGGSIFPAPYAAVAQITPGKRTDISLMPTGDQVNVTFWRKDRQSIALELSVRYDQGVIIRSAMTEEINKWTPEEKDGQVELSDTEILDLTVFYEESSFLIFVNGNNFTTFQHRGPPHDIVKFQIEGSFDLHSASVTISN